MCIEFDIPAVCSDVIKGGANKTDVQGLMQAGPVCLHCLLRKPSNSSRCQDSFPTFPSRCFPEPAQVYSRPFRKVLRSVRGPASSVHRQLWRQQDDSEVGDEQHSQYLKKKKRNQQSTYWQVHLWRTENRLEPAATIIINSVQLQTWNLWSARRTLINCDFYNNIIIRSYCLQNCFYLKLCRCLHRFSFVLRCRW